MRTILFALTVLVAPVIASAQTVHIRRPAPSAALTAPQVTTLAGVVTALWPSVTPAKIDAVHFWLDDDGQYYGVATWSTTIDQATLFGLATALKTVPAGMSSSEMSTTTLKTQVTGSTLTTLGGLVTTVFAVSNPRVLDCTRDPDNGVISCALIYMQSYTAAQLWTYYQSLLPGQSLVPGS